MWVFVEQHSGGGSRVIRKGGGYYETERDYKFFFKMALRVDVL